MAESKQVTRSKLMGLLKVKNGIIEYVDKTVMALLRVKKPIAGQLLSSFIPDYILPRTDEKPRSKILTINSKKLLITSILLPPPLKYYLVMLYPVDHIDPVSKETKTLRKIYPDIDQFIESMVSDIFITDGNGVILHVSSTFKDLYGVTNEEVEGKTVFELEQKKIFNVSATAIVLKKRKKVTIEQETREGQKLVITAVPIFNKKNQIQSVVSYSRNIHEYLELRKRYEKLENQVKRYYSEIRELREKEMRFLGIVAKSVQMKNILNLAMKVAAVDTNLVISGESGVGKNLITRLIHQNGARKKGPFVEINCGAIPGNLLESELFGYELGAFTGARKEGKIGMIELAQEGTLFLDEIGELPLALQVKLLKVIQEKKMTKIGGTKLLRVDFRLIAATNRDLEILVKEGQFREDLFYRLNVVPLKIPPLRERPEDILLLITHFLDQANRRYQKQKTLSNQATELLLSYGWPGNVRELENLIERIVITTDQENICVNDLPNDIQTLPAINLKEGLSLNKAKEMLEKHMVLKAYERFKSTVGVGRSLSISQASASRKIKKHVAEYS